MLEITNSFFLDNKYRTINDYVSSPADGDVLTDIGVQKVTIDTFISGKPGFEEYDDFSLYDAWVAVFDEWMLYQAGINNLFYFNFDKLERGELNYEKKTATYSIKAHKIMSDKCRLFTEALKNGTGFFHIMFMPNVFILYICVITASISIFLFLNR